MRLVLFQVKDKSIRCSWRERQNLTALQLLDSVWDYTAYQPANSATERFPTVCRCMESTASPYYTH